MDIDAGATIQQFRSRVTELLGAEYPTNETKVVFKGRMLTEGTLGDNGVADNAIIVVMGPRRPRPTPAASAPAPTPAPTQPQRPQQPAPQRAPQHMPSPSEMVADLMSLGGFSEMEVVQALRATGMDPDAAANILLSTTIGDGPQQPDTDAPILISSGPTPSFAGDVPTEMFPSLTGAVQTTGGDAPPMAIREFINDPRLEGLRDAVVRDPMLMQEILGQMAEANPELLQQIQTSPDMFLQLMGRGLPEDEHTEGPPETSGGRQGPVRVDLDRRQVRAIEGLAATFGLPRQIVLQVFVECGLDVEATGSYLYQHLARLRELAQTMGEDITFPR